MGLDEEGLIRDGTNLMGKKVRRYFLWRMRHEMDA